MLVVGACGQLGSELTIELRKVYGVENVIASDIKPPSGELLDGPFENIDVLNKPVLIDAIKKYKIKEVYHLAAVLSAKAELNPLPSWELNMQSLLNILELGREKLVNKIFYFIMPV